MSTPGVEPGLSRPQRDVLTTRRCGRHKRQKRFAFCWQKLRMKFVCLHRAGACFTCSTEDGWARSWRSTFSSVLGRKAHIESHIQRQCDFVRKGRCDHDNVTAVGFEPTPLRTGALSQRLRPLGQTVLIEKQLRTHIRTPST